MFEALSERLAAALKKITGRGVLRPEDVDAGLREVRIALLEADVNFKVVKEFAERVRARLTGVEISPGLTAPQTVVKAVHDELVELLGGNSEGLRYSSRPPTVIMLAGLQGSGKTTTAVKLALLARRDGHRPLLAALDYRRPAAVDQLRTLASRENVAFHTSEGNVDAIANASLAEAKRLNADVVILDTAGRLHIDVDLMSELKRLKAAVPITETLLVADSMTGQEGGMGSLEGMLDMIPGGGALKGQLAGADPEKEMRRMEAIILSMTPKERANPQLIDGARKRRIARGSGVQPADINRLLKAREAMQKLAKQFGTVGRKGKLGGLPRMYGQGGTGW